MHIAELWRYPVKSMGGEMLEEARLSEDGIAGDRILAVLDASGKVLTARTRPLLLAHRATLGPDGEPLVDGRPWTHPSVVGDVEAAAGAGARLARVEGPGRFDMEPLLVATDGAIASLGYDRRRFRPNLLVGGVDGLAERTWERRRLRAGECLIAVGDLRGRCVMTTFDPDTVAQDVNVLRRIVREMGGTLALDCRVARGGTLRVGDPVELE